MSRVIQPKTFVGFYNIFFIFKRYDGSFQIIVEYFYIIADIKFLHHFRFYLIDFVALAHLVSFGKAYTWRRKKPLLRQFAHINWAQDEFAPKLPKPSIRKLPTIKKFS